MSYVLCIVLGLKEVKKNFLVKPKDNTIGCAKGWSSQLKQAFHFQQCSSKALMYDPLDGLY